MHSSSADQGIQNQPLVTHPDMNQEQVTKLIPSVLSSVKSYLETLGDSASLAKSRYICIQKHLTVNDQGNLSLDCEDEVQISVEGVEAEEPFFKRAELLSFLLDACTNVLRHKFIETDASGGPTMPAIRHRLFSFSAVQEDQTGELDSDNFTIKVGFSGVHDQLNDFLENLQVRDHERSWLEAAEKGDIQKLQTLLDNRKFNINARNEMGYTALHLAVHSGCIEAVQFLIENGVDMNIKCRYHEQDVFYRAVQCYSVKDPSRARKQKEIIQYLHKLSPEFLKSKDKFGNTPFERSVQFSSLHQVELLHSLGCDVNVVNEKGMHISNFLNSGHICKSQTEKAQRQLEVAKFFLSNGSDLSHANVAFMAAARVDDIAMVRLLCENGVDVQKKNKNGENAYAIAAEAGAINVIKFLSSLGAVDHNVRDVTYGRSALLWSVCNKDNDLFKHLWSVAEVNRMQVDSDNWMNVMHLAVMYENLDILKFLLDQPVSSGLNVYQVDVQGRNLLHLAAEGTNREIETYLQGLNIFDMDSKGQYHLSPREIAQQRRPQVGPEGEGVGRSSFFSEEKTSANGAQLVR